MVRNLDTLLIYVWPDYTYIEAREYNEEEYRPFGDDFMQVLVPLGVDIDTYLLSIKIQG